MSESQSSSSSSYSSSSSSLSGSDLVTHRGGCHCGRVTFAIQAPADLVAESCNCSICHKTGYLHVFVDRKHFHLHSGHDALTAYTFNTGVAQHTFCRHCGIKSFYIPRSHPDRYSVNGRCLDDSTIASMRVNQFDGRNWEANIEALHRRT